MEMSKLKEYLCPKCGRQYLGLSPRQYEYQCPNCFRCWTIIEGHNKLKLQGE